jgi:hypothetical protein
MCEKSATLRFESELFEHLQTEEVVVCYSHECLWIDSTTADSAPELPYSERYEFDFGSPEMAYAAATAIIEILEESMPGIKQKSLQVSKIRKY